MFHFVTVHWCIEQQMWKETAQQRYKCTCKKKVTWRADDVRWNRQKAWLTLDVYEERFHKTINVKENAKVVEEHTAMIQSEYD